MFFLFLWLLCNCMLNEPPWSACSCIALAFWMIVSQCHFLQQIVPNYNISAASRQRRSQSRYIPWLSRISHRAWCSSSLDPASSDHRSYSQNCASRFRTSQNFPASLCVQFPSFPLRSASSSPVCHCLRVLESVREIIRIYVKLKLRERGDRDSLIDRHRSKKLV